MHQPDDKDLIKQLHRDSSQAFEYVFNQYHQRIFNFCVRLMPSYQDSREIVQKVFVALWEQRNQIDINKSLSAYLFSIARYMVYQEFRKKVYQKATLEQIVEQEPVYANTTKDDVLFNELLSFLTQIIEELPDRQREIFKLSREQGLSYQEIADQLGISENTVDTQMRRALAYLREKYGKLYPVIMGILLFPDFINS